ncbi:MAG: penicillin-binding transpeptidase domain-containing protein [Akkermansia sp.]
MAAKPATATSPRGISASGNANPLIESHKDVATPIDSGDEDFVPTVTEGADGKKPGETNSGKEEGVGLAPEYTPDSQEEQRGDATIDAKPAQKSGAGGRSEQASQAFSTTRTSARTMALLLPAPRGPILDRNGEVLAQTQVAYHIALKYGNGLESEDKAGIIAFARNALVQAHKLVDQTWVFTDEMLLNHFRHRRWLPLPITNVIRADEAKKIKSKVEAIPGLTLLPIYIRYYPEGKTAAHIPGYVGSKGKLPTGPINHMDPLWEQTEGRSGLEQQFNAPLTGKPGVWRLMFDEEGNKVLDELQTKPKPGGALVTTLDLKWQKAAEKALSEGSNRRGAMVVLDCKTGEILVMASTPSYDPNKFIPHISQKDYDALRKDPGNPLVSRAFQGKYPPASTFKVVTVLSALKHGIITPDTMVNCPASVAIGNHRFNNWSKNPAGDIDCVQALAMSNNPFMYTVSCLMGKRSSVEAAEDLLSTAKMLGFGSRTGLDIPDQEGLVPNNEYMLSTFKRTFTMGDVANMSIGQGVLLASPLQVAHAMSGIANGYGLPKLHLIKQIQDSNSNVIYAASPEIQTSLADYEQATAAVRMGMKAVVEGGTGSRARLNYSSIAGKSGTAQWGPERENRRLAWFAGFMPYENPRYAYAVLYEGRPGEKLGGGAMSAPIVKKFFENPEVKKDVLSVIKPPKEEEIPVAEPVEGENDGASTTVPANANNKVHLIDNADDSSDAVTPEGNTPADIRREEGSLPSPVPLPGDVDYNPGLINQIPRNLNHPTQVQDAGNDVDNVPPPPQEEIPDAEPL